MINNLEDYYQIENLVSGIEKGDILYIISDITKIALEFARKKQRFDMNRFIDSIIEAVGDEGCIIFPTYNWDFRDGLPFDYNNTPSHMGSLTQCALKRKDFKRTRHPIHSCAVWGKYKDYLTSIDPIGSFDEDSIFGFMHKKKAKAVAIGIESMQGMTFIHYGEQKIGVPFREDKDYTNIYIDENGVKEERTYKMYTIRKDFKIEKIDLFKRLGDIGKKLGVVIPFQHKIGECSIIDLQGLYKLLELEFGINHCKNTYKYEYKGKNE